MRVLRARTSLAGVLPVVRRAGRFRGTVHPRQRDAVLGLILALAALLNAWIYRGWVVEDAFVTFRYARNLAEGLGFVFNPGERVLGTPSPLWTLGLAVFGAVGVEVAAAGRFLFCVALSVAAWIGYRILAEEGHPLAGTLFAGAAVWNVGGTLRWLGTETALFVALLLAAVWTARRDRPWVVGVLLGLLCLTRYEGLVPAAVVLLWRAVASRRPPWREVLAASGFVVPWLLFAWLHFGRVLPTTLVADAGATGFFELWSRTAIRQAHELWPVGSPLGATPAWVQLAGSVVLLLPIPVVLGGWARRRPALAVLVACGVLLWSAVALLGPPIESAETTTPAALILVLAALGAWGEILRRPLAREPARRRAEVATVAVVAAGLFFLPARAKEEVEVQSDRGFVENRIDAQALLAEWILGHGLEDLAVLTYAPGLLGYTTGQPVVDGAGLVSEAVHLDGETERRTDLATLVARFEPPLVVRNGVLGWLPDVVRDGYLTVFDAPGSMSLLMARTVWEERYPVLHGSWASPGSALPPAPPPPPEGWSFDRALPPEWNRRDWRGYRGEGRESGVVGKPARTLLSTKGGSTRTGMAWSDRFAIDFDEIVFSWAANGGAQTQVHLVVDGWPVLELIGGGDAPPLDLREARVPVYPWRGKSAFLRVVDEHRGGAFVVLDDVRFVRYPRAELFDDFEDGWSGRWRDRFAPQPASTAGLGHSGSGPSRVGRAGFKIVHGAGLAGTWGLEDVRRLVSRPFVVEHDALTFAHYDFSGGRTGVELVVGGEVVASLVGRASGELQWITWDLTPWRGRAAVLRAVDGQPRAASGFGIDSILLHDAPSP